MSKIIPFTDNYADLSNEDGYQFEFRCERCGNGYRSPFQQDVAEKGRGLLRAAGSLFGGKVAELSGAAQALDRGTNSKKKDKALLEAVQHVEGEFKQCRGCGNWVCQQVCWNAEVGQCLNCSPSVADELSKAQAAAQISQIQQKVQDTDWTADIDTTTRAIVTCPKCNARVDGGKFCPSCGTALVAKKFCSNCGAEQKDGVKFCSECGTGM